ncbi:helix-turn-helix transcriptional regulator [Novosphingobium sp.]|uniref:helix-turn-helix domain-containing protein n=1 Tax=Novosphingobium sp. TaxID=1874826 RepID=UPI003458C115
MHSAARPTTYYRECHGRRQSSWVKCHSWLILGELRTRRIRARRKAAGLTQERLAELGDVAPRTIQKFEAGDIVNDDQDHRTHPACTRLSLRRPHAGLIRSRQGCLIPAPA